MSFFQKSMGVVESIGKGFGFLAAAAAIFSFGVWYDGKDAPTTISNAEDRGFQRGLAESNATYNSNEHQTEFFAKIIAYINSNKTNLTIQDAVGTDLTNALAAAKKGDFEQAAKSLDPASTAVNIGACVRVGKAIEMEANKVVDQCETKGEITYRGYNKYDEINHQYGFYLNGRFDEIKIGERTRISNDYQCYLSLLRVEKRGDTEFPVVRVSCEP